MIFTPKDMWLYENQEYRAVAERVIEESIALDKLQDAMFVFRTEPEDHEAIARQRSKLKAAIEARREVLLRLMNEHPKGGEHR
jgi:hypothetical protein